MRMRFFGPFYKLLGQEIDLHLSGPVSLEQLIRLLSSRYSVLEKYSKSTTDADLSAHIVFVREGRPLRLSDPIKDDDVVQVLLPVTGG